MPDRVAPGGNAAGRDLTQEDLLGQYLKEIARHPLLTDVEEVELARAIEQGEDAAEELAQGGPLSPQRRTELEGRMSRGRAAERRFIQSNLRLAVSVAKKYSWGSLSLLDLIQEGNLGLMRAVQKFDWRRGFKFSTYATWWIRQAITRALMDKGSTIRIPVHMAERLQKIRRVQSELYESLGREPYIEEIADRIELPAEKVIEALNSPTEPRSINEPVGDESDTELGDVMPDRASNDPFDEVSATQDRQAIARMVKSLPEGERRVITHRYGIATGQPLTLRQTADALGLKLKDVRALEASALSRLRHPSLQHSLQELVA
jgi:RNA polymerase primary sigma factor